MRTEILRSILFEVEGIRKLLLEPKLTTGTATGQGGCSSTTGTISTHGGICCSNTNDQKPKLPESWDELPVQTTGHIKVGNMFVAHRRLYDLRQAYWQAEGWEPDYIDYTQEKFVVIFDKEEIEIHQYNTIRRFLAFPTRAQAEHFLKHHRALIEQAGELL